MIRDIKIKGMNNLKVCENCLREVKTIYLEYEDTDKNIFIIKDKGICKRCLNKTLKLQQNTNK